MESEPPLAANLQAVLEVRTAGDPDAPGVLWTDLSPGQIAEAVSDQGTPVSGLIQECILSPLRTHDLAHAGALHPQMRRGDLLIADRAFESFAHLALLLGQHICANSAINGGAGFTALIRMARMMKDSVRAFSAGDYVPSGKGDEPTNVGAHLPCFFVPPMFDDVPGDLIELGARSPQAAIPVVLNKNTQDADGRRFTGAPTRQCPKYCVPPSIHLHHWCRGWAVNFPCCGNGHLGRLSWVPMVPTHENFLPSGFTGSVTAFSQDGSDKANACTGACTKLEDMQKTQ